MRLLSLSWATDTNRRRQWSCTHTSYDQLIVIIIDHVTNLYQSSWLSNGGLVCAWASLSSVNVLVSGTYKSLVGTPFLEGAILDFCHIRFRISELNPPFMKCRKSCELNGWQIVVSHSITEPRHWRRNLSLCEWANEATKNSVLNRKCAVLLCLINPQKHWNSWNPVTTIRVLSNINSLLYQRIKSTISPDIQLIQRDSFSYKQHRALSCPRRITGRSSRLRGIRNPCRLE